MNDETDPVPANAGALVAESNIPPSTVSSAPFFDWTDWAAFGLTSFLVFVVYWFMLPPSLTLGDSGMLSTAAYYGGIANPPGYPIWCIYAWVFTKLLPFSDIAWRVSVSSAFAGALVCGVIALMISRGGAAMLEGLRGFEHWQAKENKSLRVVSGYVAGTAFGFDNGFWYTAIDVDVWPMSMLLFAVVICLMLRWHHAPERMRYLYGAVFVYGLALCNSQALAVVAVGLILMVMFADPALARDLFSTTTLLAAATLVGRQFELLPDFWHGVLRFDEMWPVYVAVTIFAALASTVLIVKTTGVFTEWRKVVACGLCLMLGLLPNLYLPIASVTTPPMNWGYPRTYDGFIHTLSRGQYEGIYPTHDVVLFARQVGAFGKSTILDFGLIYIALALVPFCFLRRMRVQDRYWMFGLSFVFLCLSLFWVAMLNPNLDRASIDLNGEFFTPAHLVLAVWSGYGLILFGKAVTAPKRQANI